MTDRRLTACNGRVAAMDLKGSISAEQYVEGEMQQVAANVLTIWRDSTGFQKERELLFGDNFLVLENVGSRGFGQSEKDGYVGYVDLAGLHKPTKPTHQIISRNTHLYAKPDIKSATLMSLTFGSRLSITDADTDTKFM